MVGNQTLYLLNHLRTGDGEDNRTRRVKTLNAEQRAAVQSLTSPDQVPLKERRRQYNAIHRRMENDKSLPPGLAEKWAAAKTSQEKLLGCNQPLTLLGKNIMNKLKPVSKPLSNITTTICDDHPSHLIGAKCHRARSCQVRVPEKLFAGPVVSINACGNVLQRVGDPVNVNTQTCK